MNSSPRPARESWLASFWRDHQAVAIVVAALIGAPVVIIAALVGGDVINISAGGAIQPSTAPPSSSTSPPPTTTTPEPDPTPTVTVRRSTEKHSLVLSDRYYADLDSMSPDWDVTNNGTDDFDIQLSAYYQGAGLSAAGNSELATVSGPASYDTCLMETGYVADEVDPAKPGTRICIKTSEHRYAFITIEKLISDEPGNVEKIKLTAVVWDPPFEE
jgi:hypothetical protein